MATKQERAEAKAKKIEEKMAAQRAKLEAAAKKHAEQVAAKAEEASARRAAKAEERAAKAEEKKAAAKAASEAKKAARAEEQAAAFQAKQDERAERAAMSAQFKERLAARKNSGRRDVATHISVTNDPLTRLQETSVRAQVMEIIKGMPSDHEGLIAIADVQSACDDLLFGLSVRPHLSGLEIGNHIEFHTIAAEAEA